MQNITEAQAARFWATVDKTGGEDACWLWPGTLNNGYGHVSATISRDRLAHRVAWRITHGHIPPETPCVLHACDVWYPVDSFAYRRCCNPNHLWLGTKADNCRDRHAKGRTASGERSGMRKHPERIARGDMSWSRRHPERLFRGHHPPRYTPEFVAAVRNVIGWKRWLSHREIGWLFGVSKTTVRRIETGEIVGHPLTTRETECAAKRYNRNLSRQRER